MSTDVDLRQLAIDRTRGDPAVPRPRHVATRYVLPAAIVAGFAGLVAWAARESFLPRVPVTVVPVVVVQGEVRSAGQPLFQAAGWIEPRPTPIVVSSLIEGIIEKVLVVEGQDVRPGDEVARLIDTDARLALKQAEADLELKRAELAGAQAELAAAGLRLEQPVHLEAALAEAGSLLAQAEKELARLPFEITAAEARRDVAQRDVEGKRAAGAGIAGRLLEKAQGELNAAEAALGELRQRKPHLERMVAALAQRRDALQRQLALRVDETRQQADAKAKLEAAQARVRQAELAVESARLRWERTIVKAPVAGRVLQLVARPGARMMGQIAGSNQDASTILTLYDPAMLQVRCDVRLEDVARVQPGQKVRIETASAAEPMAGEVLQVTSQANIQKNTLEVKVAILDPPPPVRPEMLVQATFLAPETPAAK
ncbi:MAG: HlyD family efflux transporter periplasmic adaptor subunit, partial [Thermoguttaceae bacterium]|nr:HlyD family efflux transporter periplasmic adaptor subunit [Thermoguttaceae bacterium]